ncbi:MAG TPA: conjugal transfer protein TraF [Vicinamibacterales bacterium]|nr:conjugal transfer protein TraF [Vicinamibacterales bacterium]
MHVESRQACLIRRTTLPALPTLPIVFFTLLALWPVRAAAQSGTGIGVRAQGLAGAFTAVADDATATWWNPAGLATGAIFNAVVEFDGFEEPRAGSSSSGVVPSWQLSAGGLSVAFPAFGLSYYRLRLSEIQANPTIGVPNASRQDQGTADVRLRSLVLNQFGATVGQSLGGHLVVGSTLKLVRGSLGVAVRSGSGVSLDDASALDGSGETHAGLDMGAMATWGSIRLGLVARNVTQPTFGAGSDSMTLKREVRAGVAATPTSDVTVAFDADLTTHPTAVGDERQAAAGLEVWSRDRRLGVRGGISASTVGSARSSASGGASWALRHGVYIEGAGTVGADNARRGWGFDLRVTY